jgi:hypothetical protein
LSRCSLPRPALAAELDTLLVVDTDLGSTRLHWLTTGASRATPAAVKAELAKLAFLRDIGAAELDLGVLPSERRRYLAAIGRRSTAQALARSGPERRYPVMVALVAQLSVDVLDEVVQLYDQAVSATDHRAERKVEEQLVTKAKASEDRLGLLDELLSVLTDPQVPDEAVGTRLRGGIGMDRLRTAKEAGPRRLPRDHGHLGLIEASYSHLREFAPAVLAAVHFDGGTAARPLLEAVQVLKELNASGARKVPYGAPDEFVPTRWREYLDHATVASDHAAYRHSGTACAQVTCSCPARAATTTRPATCSPPSSGGPSGPSSARWSSGLRTRQRPGPVPNLSWSWLWATSTPCSRRGTAR